MRSSNKKTIDFDGMKYSPELIRQLEDPEYAKAAEEYEKQAQKDKKSKSKISVDYTKSEVGEPTGRRSQGKRNKGKKKYKLNKFKLIRNIVLILLILFLIISGLFFVVTRTFDKVDTSNADFGIGQKAAEELSGYRNVAILGVDARADEGYDGSRTDAIIVLSINKRNGDVRLISVMRDSYLKMDYFPGEDREVLDKLTHAHHYAGGVNTCKAMNQSMDLNIDEFVIFNWKAVADIVDSLGGITINVKEDEIADMNRYGNESARNVDGTYTRIESAGKQTLNGAAAVTYCRIRKSSGGDSGRGARYKKVVKAVMKKSILHPGKLMKMSNDIFPNIRTNMSQTELYTLALGFPVYDFQPSISWPKTYYSGLLSDDIAYVVPQTLESNVKRLHKKAFGQGKYKVSKKCAEISEEIMYDTGIY